MRRSNSKISDSQPDIIYALYRASYLYHSDSRQWDSDLLFPKPSSITSVNNDHDLSAVYLQEFTVNDETFIFKEGLILNVFRDESGKYLCAALEEHALDIYATNRDELIEDIKEEYAFMWHEYVESDQATLSAKAKELADNLRSVLNKV